MKKAWSILLCAAFLLSLVTVTAFAESANEAKIGNTPYATLADAVAAANEDTDVDTIELLKDVTVTASGNYALTITQPVIIDGGESQFAITTGTKSLFGVHADATFKNLKLSSTNASGRCINTRVGGITVLVENCELKTTGNSYTQVILVGGDAGNTDAENRVSLTVKKSTVNVENHGYGIAVFNPTDLTIENSSVSGYAAVYMQGPNYSVGSKGSVLKVVASQLSSVNNFPKADGSNSFATIAIQDKDVQVIVDKDSTISASVTGGADQSLIDMSDVMTNGVNTNEAVTGTQIVVKSGAKLDASSTGEGKAVIVSGYVVVKDDQGDIVNSNTVVLPVDYAEQMGKDGEGYMCAIIDGQLYVLSPLEDKEQVVGHTHQMTKVPAKPACTEDGNEEYYLCSHSTCANLFFADEKGDLVLIKEPVIKKQGHNYEEGKCTACGGADPDYKVPVTDGDETDKTEQPDKEVPHTGDSFPLALCLVLMILSAAGVACSVVLKKKTTV